MGITKGVWSFAVSALKPSRKHSLMGMMTRSTLNEHSFIPRLVVQPVSFMSVCLMAVGGISWGLKLESRIDKYADTQQSMRERFLADLATTQAVIARGMLPVTEVKLTAIEKRLDAMEEDIEQCLRKNKASLSIVDRTQSH